MALATHRYLSKREDLLEGVAIRLSHILRGRMKRFLPWFAIVVVLIGTALLLRSQGRLWVCSCGYLLLWSSDP
jgi:hypothetical protein